MNRIVEIGSKKIDKLFNIVKIAKDLRDTKHNIVSEKTKKKFKIESAQNPKRVLRVVS